MYIHEVNALLRDGRTMLVRSPREEDAEELLDYLRATAGETNFLNSYPEDITLTAEEERAFLRRAVDSPRTAMLCALDGARVAGVCSVNPVGPRPKQRHRCVLGIAVRKEYCGNGLGDLLLRMALDQARRLGYARIELGVFEPNTRARALYEKYDFEVCGRIPDAARLKDGTSMADLLMTRAL